MGELGKNNIFKNMKKIVLLILIPLLSYSQTSEINNIKSSIEIFFEGFHKKDSVLMKSILHRSFGLQSVAIRENKVSKKDINGNEFISIVVNRPEKPIWNEKLLSYEIKVDGPLANAWVKYEFWIDEKLSHCGVNSIHLLRDGIDWKIFSISDSRRKDCN